MQKREAKVGPRDRRGRRRLNERNDTCKNPHRNALSGAGPGIRGSGRLDGGVRSQMRTGLHPKFPAIPRLSDDPKLVAVDDAEVVGDSIAEAVPVLGNCVFQEFQNCSLELPERFVVPVVGRVLVHESPTLFDRIEMGTIWRDEVQHGFSVLLF